MGGCYWVAAFGALAGGKPDFPQNPVDYIVIANLPGKVGSQGFTQCLITTCSLLRVFAILDVPVFGCVWISQHTYLRFMSCADCALQSLSSSLICIAVILVVLITF